MSTDQRTDHPNPAQQKASDNKMSDEQKELLVHQVAEAAKEKVSRWAKWFLGFSLAILTLFGFQYQISLRDVDGKIKSAVSERLEVVLKEKSGEVDRLSQKMLDKHIESLSLTLTESSKILQELRTASSEEHKKVRGQLDLIAKEADKLKADAEELIGVDLDAFGNKVKRIKELADDIGATNLTDLTIKIDGFEKSLRDGQALVELHAKTVDSRINGLEFSPPGSFLCASQVIGFLEPRLTSGDSVMHVLLIFAKDNQRTWLVTTNQGRLFAVLNNKDKFPTTPLVDARISDVTRVEHYTTSQGGPGLDIGVERLIYTPQLFPSTDHFLNAVKGILNQVKPQQL